MLTNGAGEVTSLRHDVEPPRRRHNASNPVVLSRQVRIAVPKSARPKNWMGYFFIRSLEYADKVGYTKCSLEAGVLVVFI